MMVPGPEPRAGSKGLCVVHPPARVLDCCLLSLPGQHKLET